jgi:hypothetical protein
MHPAFAVVPLGPTSAFCHVQHPTPTAAPATAPRAPEQALQIQAPVVNEGYVLPQSRRTTDLTLRDIRELMLPDIESAPTLSEGLPRRHPPTPTPAPAALVSAPVRAQEQAPQIQAPPVVVMPVALARQVPFYTVTVPPGPPALRSVHVGAVFGSHHCSVQDVAPDANSTSVFQEDVCNWLPCPKTEREFAPVR